MAHVDDEEEYPHFPPRGLGRRKADQPRVNWSAVSVIFAISVYVFGSLAGWFGANAAEVRKINERLATLETQRYEDVRRMERIERSGERVEDKVDRILQRVQQ